MENHTTVNVTVMYFIPAYDANINVTSRDFVPLTKFLSGAVICNITPTQGNRDAV